MVKEKKAVCEALTEAGKVRRHAKIFLRSADRVAEAGDRLVEDANGTMVAGAVDDPL
jgi:hypothetical protein